MEPRLTQSKPRSLIVLVHVRLIAIVLVLYVLYMSTSFRNFTRVIVQETKMKVSKNYKEEGGVKILLFGSISRRRHP